VCVSSRLSILVSVLCVTAVAWSAPAAVQSQKPAAIVSPANARDAYLGHAVIWHEPAALSPDGLLAGPEGVFPYKVAEATTGEGIACTFSRPGVSLGGKSAKFICRSAEGRDLRVKYWNVAEQSGNREVFATVAATRLMWALGFAATPSLPMNIRCDGCPIDPMRGTGQRGQRRYLAMWQLPVPGLKIVSQPETDQGWSWRELEAAIEALPPGEERTRQQTHFAALTLLGVLLQHGDRKPEQQALYCAGDVDVSAGEVRTPGNGDSKEMLFERAGARACPQAVAAVVDVGATFGGGGKTSNAVTAKMNLENWAKKPVFTSDTRECRGELTISMAAGSGGNSHPHITEAGRQFLAERLHQLTDDHMRAIFRAARVDQLPEHRSKTPGGAAIVEAWVAAFKDKIKQIDARHCGPAS
jgi:hypothetical protein